MRIRRYEIFRCWAAPNGSSVMVPSPTGYRYVTRRGAERFAAKLSMVSVSGGWFEVHPVEAAAR